MEVEKGLGSADEHSKNKVKLDTQEMRVWSMITDWQAEPRAFSTTTFHLSLILNIKLCILHSLNRALTENSQSRLRVACYCWHTLDGYSHLTDAQRISIFTQHQFDYSNQGAILTGTNWMNQRCKHES